MTATHGAPSTGLRRVLSAVVSLAMFPAVAQQPAPEATGGVLQEVIVTAKQRQESLQEVPLSITAFSREALRDSQALDLRDLAALTPGLSVGSGGGRTDPTAVAMRGVVPNTSDERFQGLTVFIDGIALSGQLLGLDTTQVERIEVLKGPQSATFGRATYSGAINYVTRTPSGDSATGGLRMRGGRNEDALGPNYYLGGDLTMPLLADRLWLGVTASQSEYAGLYRDPADGSRIGQETSKSAVATLFFKATDALSLKARLSFDEDKDTMAARHVQHPREWLLEGVPTVRLSRAGGALWATELPDATPGLTASLDKGKGRPLDGGNERERAFGSLIATYDVAGYEISYSLGYLRSLEWRINNFFSRATQPGQDPLYGPLIGSAVTVSPFTTTPTSSNPNHEIFENMSHQFLVVSPGDERLRWRAGVYFFEENNVNYFRALANATNPAGQLSGEQEFDNQAIFAGADYDLTDRLTLGVEGRYQQEKNVWGECPTCVQVRTIREEVREEKEFLPRATVNFSLTPDNMLYALYSMGTKSGRLSSLAIANAGQPDFVYAQPEELDNFEIGSKNTFWDGRAIVNVALYRIDVTNQQVISTQDVLTSAGTRLITAAFNVGESRVNGAEVEATVRPLDAWTLGLGLGYADQEFTNGNPVVLSASSAVTFPGRAGDPVVLAGKRQANVPVWNGAVSASYKAPLGGAGLELNVRTDALYRGSFYGDLANIAKVPDSWKLNLRAAVARNDTWEAAFYGRNLLNDLTIPVTGLAGGAATCTYIENDTAQYGTAQQCMYAIMPRTRELGIEFTYRL